MEILRETDHLEDLGADREVNNIRMNLTEIKLDDVDWLEIGPNSNIYLSSKEEEGKWLIK
jgi:hypothetical protein